MMQTNFPQQFNMQAATGYPQFQPAVAHVAAPMKPATPEEPPGVADVKKYLKRLCEAYSHGTMIQPTVNKKKAGVFGKSEPKRSGIIKRIDTEQGKILTGLVPQANEWHNIQTHFVLLNMVGSVNVLSEYLASRLSRTTSVYDIDCAQIAVASIFQFLTRDPETFLSKDNIRDESDLRVLKFFVDYRMKDLFDAESKKEEADKFPAEQLAKYVSDYRADVVNRFYETFVLGVFDTAVRIVKDKCAPILHQLGGEGQYCFVAHIRDQMKQYVMSKFYPEIAEAIKLQVKDYLLGLSVVVSRKDYYNAENFEEKVKDESGTVTLLNLAPLMARLCVVESYSLGLPSWTRKEDPSGNVFYGKLELRGTEAHKLAYMFGVNWKGASLVKEHDVLPGDGSKRKIKILTSDGACEKITKNFAKHFDPHRNKPSNRDALNSHEKFIDISEAVISSGTGLQISPSNDNVVLPYVNYPYSIANVMNSEDFERRPAEERLKMILANIGYIHGKMQFNQVRAVISDLYKVFGVPEPSVELNTTKKRGAPGGSIFGPQAQYMQAPQYAQYSQYMQAPQYAQSGSSDVI